jgi:hypothetical protein
MMHDANVWLGGWASGGLSLWLVGGLVIAGLVVLLSGKPAKK